MNSPVCCCLCCLCGCVFFGFRRSADFAGGLLLHLLFFFCCFCCCFSRCVCCSAFPLLLLLFAQSLSLGKNPLTCLRASCVPKRSTPYVACRSAVGRPAAMARWRRTRRGRDNSPQESQSQTRATSAVDEQRRNALPGASSSAWSGRRR